MSDIVIKGMELPKPSTYPITLSIYPNGNIYIHHELSSYKAIEVPAHGRLGDITQFVEDIINSKTLRYEFTDYQLTLLRQLAKNTPTVIEASTEERE